MVNVLRNPDTLKYSLRQLQDTDFSTDTGTLLNKAMHLGTIPWEIMGPVHEKRQLLKSPEPGCMTLMCLL